MTPLLEIFYGGAGGGGKSDALLMAALQYVDTPSYAALMLRRTYSDLALPGALMERAHSWLDNTDARWSEERKTWHFPSGATITFGYLESEQDKMRYRGGQYQFIAFDELTQFTESQYRFLFSRLRRLRGMQVPLRMRSASNPGDVGHDWVYQRFILGDGIGNRMYIPARLEENPFLDTEEYTESLMELDPVTRAQILQGDWEVRPATGFFNRSWFVPAVPEAPAGALRVRYWDKAATKGGTGARTAGVLVAKHGKKFYVEHAVAGRWNVSEREAIIKSTAEIDNHKYPGRVTTFVEQEPGSGGKESAEATMTNLAGYAVKADRVTGDKASRASPLASQAQVGNVSLVQGPWNMMYLDELEPYPTGALKDLVDATSGAFNKLAKMADWTIV